MLRHVRLPHEDDVPLRDPATGAHRSALLALLRDDLGATHIDLDSSEKSACLILETRLFHPAVNGRAFGPNHYTSLARVNTANTTPTSLTWMLKAEDTVEVGLSEQHHDDELAADMANPRTIAYRRSAMVPANELPGLDAALPAKKPTRGASRDHHSPVT